MKHLITALALTPLLLLAGCASPYMTDRGNDAMDIFTLSGNFSFGARARTGPIHAGMAMVSADYGLGGGQFGQIGGGGAATQFGSLLDITLMTYETFHIRPDYRKKSYNSDGPILISSATTEKDNKKLYWPYFTQVEVVAGFGYGIRFGFNIGELVDFLLGWTTIDIYGDDVGIVKEKKLGPFRLHYSPNEIQIIGNKKELWILIECYETAKRTNPRSYSGIQSVGMGTVQEVLILTKNGLKSRFKIPRKDQVSFDTSHTHLFAVSDQVYLYYGESMNYLPSIFKWDKNHFKLILLAESEAFISKNIARDKKISLKELKEVMPAEEAEDLFKHHTEYHGYKDGKIEIPYGVMEDLLDKLSEKNGWTNYSKKIDDFQAFIKWDGVGVDIKKIKKGKSFEIEIRSSVLKIPGSAIFIDYDKQQEITIGELKKELKQDEQTGHKKGFWD